MVKEARALPESFEGDGIIYPGKKAALKAAQFKRSRFHYKTHVVGGKHYTLYVSKSKKTKKRKQRSY